MYESFLEKKRIRLEKYAIQLKREKKESQEIERILIDFVNRMQKCNTKK